MSTRSVIQETEVEQLAALYGQPLRWVKILELGPFGAGDWAKKREGRRGEVVLVIPRAGGRVLVHTKNFYPEGLYRLPTGGIHPGEPVLNAAEREGLEETGFAVRLSQFVGVIGYALKEAPETISFASYVFRTKGEASTPLPLDAGEGIAGFRDVLPGELIEIARRLEGLEGEWADWGQFRATAHRLAGLALGEGKFTKDPSYADE